MENPRHDPNHHQLPIEAVKVWLELAQKTIETNEGITEEDIGWYIRSLTEMLEKARERFQR